VGRCTVFEPVLRSLASRRSRSSAAAIGHNFILSGAPLPVALQAIDVLSTMVCDWTVAILDQAISQTEGSRVVRRHALTVLGKLAEEAVDRGYPRLARADCRKLTRRAQMELNRDEGGVAQDEIPAVENLCDCLGEAVSDGFFPRLPDF
jgi:hypothetical protein